MVSAACAAGLPQCCAPKGEMTRTGRSRAARWPSLDRGKVAQHARSEMLRSAAPVAERESSKEKESLLRRLVSNPAREGAVRSRKCLCPGAARPRRTPAFEVKGA